MTKSTGVGRGKGGGGAKPGAGRPRKEGAIKPSDASDRVWARNPPQSATELEKLALATLRHIMELCPQDAPRVSAAREVLARAREEREISGMSGKKAQQAARVGELGAPGNRFAVRRLPPSSETMQ